ncbi:protein POLLENLESS 3 [Manihot esculenta]|uniref:Uncharacterized protein n=1 Tax=Manihot esculenta TaxID=3983 RepID=A0A2C9UM41_MANES|nr:protein POLLENLESS 3 [Manihot esculenta]OAY31582.1 hypothetical protein MANES_14G124200v8 [Manihot esculenta]
MWSHHENNIPARGFSTPPPSWKSPHCLAAMPMSERKSVSSGCKRDLFHVIHKVPAGDSPYVRAKHVQLIEKDPSRAISLFWAAINAGDRIDSALKDMAVVMKQLNRSDEAIEAIKSFRRLCPYDSQESIDNVLVELYKRSGRIEEEIEMLHLKLKNIEEGIAFGGKRTKTARSQGKKIQITVEQERSRILGNLAWAYLQHHDYGLAEQYYRKALSLEPDKNKQCNLAICLMHMNRIPEAKSLLQAVSDSCGSKQMDDSYAKSFERAVDILTELESKSVLKPAEEDKENQRSLASPLLSDKHDRGSYCGIHSEEQGNFISSSGKGPGLANKRMLDSPAAVLYTQPKRVMGRSDEEEQRRGVGWENDTVEKPSKNVSACIIRSLDGELLDPPAERNWREKSWTEVAQGKITGVTVPYQFSQPRIRAFTGYNDAHLKDENVTKSDSQQPSWRSNARETGGQMGSTNEKSDASSKFHLEQNMVVDDARQSETSIDGKCGQTFGINGCLGKNSSSKFAIKSWADMVEEEEEKLLTGKDLSPYFDGGWDYEEESADENQDSNIIHQTSCPKSPAEAINQKFEAFDLKDGFAAFSNAVSPRNPTVRRSLRFDAKNDFSTRKKHRLQVFQDITPSIDSP